MRALVKSKAGSGLQFTSVEEPDVGYGEVKIRVMLTGLCGTDLNIESWNGWAQKELEPPLIVGHEVYGEIVALGDGVKQGNRRLEVGQRVSIEGHVACSVCRNCRIGRQQMCINTSNLGVNRDGGFAEYLVVPESNVWVHLEGIDAELGVLFDPLGNAVHTALATPLTGEDVLITGAGPIGVMATAVARYAGARHVVVTDLSDKWLAMAKDAGADYVVNPKRESLVETQMALGMEEGFDVAMEMSGSQGAYEDILSNCKHGATISLLGLPNCSFGIDWGTVITRMLRVNGIYGREMYDSWYKMTFMLQSSQKLRNVVKSTVTHQFVAEDWREAFDVARNGSAGKVLLDWR